MKYNCPHCNTEFEAYPKGFSDPIIDQCPFCKKRIEWESGFRDHEDGWYCFPIKPY